MLGGHSRADLTAELPQRVFLFGGLVEGIVLSRRSLEAFFLLKLEVTACLLAHGPGGLLPHSFKLDITSVRAWARLEGTLFDGGGKFKSSGHGLGWAISSGDCLWLV